MKALWVHIIDLYLTFQYVKGRCHYNQSILVKCHERRLIPLAFFAQSLENELQCHFLTAAMIWLHRVKFGELLLGNSRDNGAHLCT